MRLFSRRLVGPLSVLLLAGCQRGCTREPPAPVSLIERTLASLPPPVKTIVGIDFAHIRGTEFWRELHAAFADDAHDQKLLADLTARTGFDPLTQIHSLVAAFPDDARRAGEFALLVMGDNLDETRLVTYASDQAALKGQTIDRRDVNGVRLWGTVGGTQGFFAGRDRFVLGGGGWAEIMAGLDRGRADLPARRAPSAADQPELRHLLERVDVTTMVWAAAILPGDVRSMLHADPRFDAASSVMRLGFSMTLGPRLEANLLAELGDGADAAALVRKVQDQVAQARRNPRALVFGLLPYLDAIKARQTGPDVRITFALDPTQTHAAVERLRLLARMRAAAR